MSQMKTDLHNHYIHRMCYISIDVRSTDSSTNEDVSLFWSWNYREALSSHYSMALQSDTFYLNDLQLTADSMSVCPPAAARSQTQQQQVSLCPVISLSHGVS